MPGAVNVYSKESWPVAIGVFTLQLPLVERRLCGSDASSKFQLTVSPVVTVTSAGDQAGVSVARIVVGACADAALALSAQMSRAASSTAQSLAGRTGDVDVEAISFLSSSPGSARMDLSAHPFRNAERTFRVVAILP